MTPKLVVPALRYNEPFVCKDILAAASAAYLHNILSGSLIDRFSQKIFQWGGRRIGKLITSQLGANVEPAKWRRFPESGLLLSAM